MNTDLFGFTNLEFFRPPVAHQIKDQLMDFGVLSKEFNGVFEIFTGGIRVHVRNRIPVHIVG